MDQKILIISNNGLSNNESNGRILSSLFYNYDKSNIHNYCIGGIPNVKDIHYIRMTDKRNIKSLLSLGYIKPDTNAFVDSSTNIGYSQVKKKKAVHYYIRNALFRLNFHITHFLTKYAIDNNIDAIFLFAADAPYLYGLARIVSKKTNKPLYIYTCEDYPLKDYNYIESGKHNNNIFFKLLIKSLKNQTEKAYKSSTKAFFNSELLMNDYVKRYAIPNPIVKYLPSNLNRVNYKTRPIKHIVYAGNLYKGRVHSLLDISEALLNIDSSVTLDIYGSIDDPSVFSNHSNINYHGRVNYDELVTIISNVDMLLHVEGFDEYHIKDCKHAFSTKISDCYMLGIPFFMYSPIEIASTKYGLSINPDYVAISKDELKSKLFEIIKGKRKYIVNYDIILKDFKAFEPIGIKGDKND